MYYFLYVNLLTEIISIMIIFVTEFVTLLIDKICRK